MKRLLLVTLFLATDVLGQTRSLEERMWEALLSGDVAGVRSALAAGLAIDAKIGPHKVKWTPLMAAAGKGSGELVDLFISLGANLNAHDGDGLTPLVIAMVQKHREIADELIEKGAKIGVEELTHSILFKDADLTRRLAKDVKVLNQHSYLMEWATPLTYALRAKAWNIALALLELGADPNLAEKESRITPLMCATDPEALEVAQALLKAGAEMDVRNQLQQTPLMNAMLAKNRALAHLLVTRGASLREQDLAGATPLMIAAHMGYADIVREMLKRGAELEWRPKPAQSRDERNGGRPREADDGDTPLMFALRGWHLDTIRVLLEAGADVNTRNWDGRSPLSVVVTLRSSRPEAGLNPEIVKLLIARGADVRERNSRGESLRQLVRSDFQGWMSMHGVTLKPDDPLTDSFKEVDDILAKAGAPR